MCAINEEKLKEARQEAWDAFEKMIDAHLLYLFTYCLPDD